MSKKSEKKNLKEAEKKASKKAKTAKIKEGDLSPEQRWEMVSTAAYYIAEHHGFTPGRSEADWKAAEKEVDLLLKPDNKKKKKKKKQKSKKEKKKD